MKQLNQILIIGAEETTRNIGALLSKASVKVTLAGDSHPRELADADMVIHCLAGDIEPRKQAFSKYDKHARPEAILATTASWGITETASATGRPERVIGLNFVFNPLEDKCAVQIAKGLDTSSETIEACRSLVEKTGAVGILVEDAPGLVLDHVMAATINEAAIMYMTGVASMEEIDLITRLCLNWPMGPFKFADAIGLDNVLATLEILSQREGTRFLPCRLIREMVAMKKLGKKTGRGFYTYS